MLTWFTWVWSIQIWWWGCEMLRRMSCWRQTQIEPWTPVLHDVPTEFMNNCSCPREWLLEFENSETNFCISRSTNTVEYFCFVCCFKRKQAGFSCSPNKWHHEHVLHELRMTAGVVAPSFHGECHYGVYIQAYVSAWWEIQIICNLCCAEASHKTAKCW
jgi:hypothetical protein